MTGTLALDWPVISVSLFNTILLTWLGLTVVLNAARRDWGVWLIAGGLLAGAVFFVSHTALLGVGLTWINLADFLPRVEFWWHVAWAPLVLCPLAWYVAVLWYSRYWEPAGDALRKRHSKWLMGTSLLAGLVLGLVLFSGLLPSLSQLALSRMEGSPEIAGIPVLPVLFVAYLFLPLGLSLDVLNRPVHPDRLMSEQARMRARPWLVRAAFLLLLVCLLAAGSIVWALGDAYAEPITPALLRSLVLMDLVISLLIAAAVLTIGQGIIRYEIFTGRTLPRAGLRRGWRRAMLLSLGYSIVVGGSFALDLHPVYSLLLTALVMIVFFALLYHRIFAEREQMMSELGAFISSEQLYDRMVSQDAAGYDAAAPFRRLCTELLGAGRGFLVPVGSLAPLVAGIAYPAGAAVPDVRALSARFTRREDVFHRVVPGEYAGCILAVSLWSGRGLSGLLLLGEKKDGSLYGQEEVEIARAACERLLDMQAGAELARRLVDLQRARLAESQVADRQARRVLHDEVLPELHTAILKLRSAAGRDDAETALSAIHGRIAGLLTDMPRATRPEFARRGLIEALRDLVEGEMMGAFDRVTWSVPEAAETAARALPPLSAEVVFHAAREALRNAARHGRPGGDALHVDVGARVEAGRFELTITDDGVGFEPGSGSLRGLSLHSTLMAIVGGTLEVESSPGTSTCVRLGLQL